MTKHLIQSIFILLTAFYLLPNTILAAELCSTVSGCPTGDASLGVDFTGLQPSDLDKGTFKVTISSSSTYSCSYGTGTAGNSGSCTASYDGSKISCQINHLDCRNKPFTVSVSRPTEYGCTASTTSVNLDNCFNNTPVTVNCNPPVDPIAATCKVNGSDNDVSVNTGGSVTWSTSDPTGGTGTYSYSWTGSDGWSGNIQSVDKSYSTTGTKNASVTISSGSQSLTLDYADCPTVAVTSTPTPTPTPTSPPTVTCGTCTVPCGGGTKSCDDGTTPACNTQSCTTGSCNVDSARKTGTTTGTATVTVNGFNRIDWKLNNALRSSDDIVSVINGRNPHIFSNLTPNTRYTVTAVGWCTNNGCTSAPCTGNPAFTTGGPTPAPPPPPPTSYKCLICGPDGPGTRGYWTNDCSYAAASGYRCSSACTDVSNKYNVTDQRRFQGACYIQGYGSTVVPAEKGKLAGRVWMEGASGPITSVSEARKLFPLKLWLFHLNSFGGLCLLPGTTYPCIFNDIFCENSLSCNGWGFDNNYFTYVFQSGNNVGYIAEKDVTKQEVLKLIDWPQEYEPVGYYTYQREAHNSRQQCASGYSERLDRNGNCLDDWCGGTCCRSGGCDTITSNYRCERTTPEYHSLGALQKGQENDITAITCQPDAPPFSIAAVVDLVFKKLPFSCNSSYQCVTDPNGIYTTADDCQTACTQPRYKCNTGNPANYVCELGTATDPYTTSNCDGLCVTPRYTISGTVKKDTTSSLCSSGTDKATLTLLGGPGPPFAQFSPATPSGAGNYSFSDLLAGTYAVTVIPVGGSARPPVTIANIILGPNNADEKNFCISIYKPWIQTVGGDIHSNTSIDLPRPPL